MVEFIKWCFKDETSGIVTLIVLGMLLTFLLRLVAVLKGQQLDDDE